MLVKDVRARDVQAGCVLDVVDMDRRPRRPVLEMEHAHGPFPGLSPGSPRIYLAKENLYKTLPLSFVMSMISCDPVLHFSSVRFLSLLSLLAGVSFYRLQTLFLSFQALILPLLS